MNKAFLPCVEHVTEKQKNKNPGVPTCCRTQKRDDGLSGLFLLVMNTWSDLTHCILITVVINNHPMGTQQEIAQLRNRTLSHWREVFLRLRNVSVIFYLKILSDTCRSTGDSLWSVEPPQLLPACCRSLPYGLEACRSTAPSATADE